MGYCAEMGDQDEDEADVPSVAALFIRPEAKAEEGAAVAVAEDEKAEAHSPQPVVISQVPRAPLGIRRKPSSNTSLR